MHPSRPYLVLVSDGISPADGVRKDGRQWRLGTDVDVAWIQESTVVGLTIGAAIPPSFAAFATLVVQDQDKGRPAQVALLQSLLRDHSPDQPWWLGYLDTGTDDVVFADAPRVTLYQGWQYVLVRAGPLEAGAWRQDPRRSWRAPGPDLIFPADHSWVLSRLWDDDWRCLGGPIVLVETILKVPLLEARRVRPDEDATPPGHRAR
jgi:hypothetical protein